MNKKYLFLFLLGFFFSTNQALATGGVSGLAIIKVIPSSTNVNTGFPVAIVVSAWTVGGYDDDGNVPVDLGDGHTENISCSAPGFGSTCNGTITHTYNSPGDYTVIGEICRVDALSPGAPLCYKDSVTIHVGGSSLCGNGNIDAGEDCDDGNILDGDGCDSACHLEGGGNATSYRNPLLWQDIPEFAHRGVIFFFTLALYSSPLLILIGAYVLLTSGGSSEKIAKGKKIIIWTLVGLAIMLLGKAIITFIKMLLGG